MPGQSIFKEVRLQLRLGQAAMAQRLGVHRCYLSELENEHRQPSPSLLQRLQELAQSASLRLGGGNGGAQNQGIPIISWAKAGVAASYEEMPPDWQARLPSDCPDPQAFGLMLEGDSMEPKYSQGDLVVVMPHTPPRPNSLVVANLAERGVVFKVFTPQPGHRVRLSSYNPTYPPIEVAQQELAWIYPAYEVRRRLWQ
jgi:SOS-response transcriptional repressor LexA